MIPARSVIIAGLSMLLLGAFATAQTKEEQLFYGTFVNEKMSPPKTVHEPGTFKDYATVSATTPIDQGSEQIVKYWTDSEGAVWYQTQATVNSRDKYQTLQKISKSGTVLEMVAKWVPDFDLQSFPTNVDPTGDTYHIYYRASQ